MPFGFLNTEMRYDCGEGLCYNALVTRAHARRRGSEGKAVVMSVCVCVRLTSTFKLTLLSCLFLQSLIINSGSRKSYSSY